MTDFAMDHFTDVIVIVLRTPKMIGKPPDQEEYRNQLGEMVYDEIEVSVNGYFVAKSIQTWKEQGISSDIAGVFICKYQDAIPAGSVIKLGDKQYHQFDVQYARGLMNDGLTRIFLKESL